MKGYLIGLSMMLLLSSCDRQTHAVKSLPHQYTVRAERISNPLFFTGFIQPLKESTLTSPFDATVEAINYRYGQMVNKNDVVVILNSHELQRQYNETLTDYLKAKDSFSITEAKFSGTQELWKAGLISKNNFLSEKSTLNTARVSLMQATRKLTEMLEKMDNSSNVDHLSQLSIAQFEQVRQALTDNHNKIQLRASSTGMLLYPPKSSEDKANLFSIGSAVKQGQVLALIGDLTGISVEIEVPEIDIDKIHPGMKALIKGVALGNQTLEGELVSINAQASAATGNGLPTFNAEVQVKKLTDAERALIKVGMSATIEIVAEGTRQLVVPISAVQQGKGATVVKIRDKNNVVETRMISTGIALMDKVVVNSGLKEGDVILYD